MKLKVRLLIFLLTLSLGGLTYSITSAYADEDEQNMACNDHNTGTCNSAPASCGSSGQFDTSTCTIHCSNGSTIACGSKPKDDDPGECCECELLD